MGKKLLLFGLVLALIGSCCVFGFTLMLAGATAANAACVPDEGSVEESAEGVSAVALAQVAGKPLGQALAALPKSRSSETGHKPTTVLVQRLIEQVFPYWGAAGTGEIHGYRLPNEIDIAQGIDWHTEGVALDVYMEGFPAAAKGKVLKSVWAVANFMVANAKQLGVVNVMWQHKSWSAGDDRGWHRYREMNSDTHNHMNHVHIQVDGSHSPSGQLTVPKGVTLPTALAAPAAPASASVLAAPVSLAEPQGVGAGPAAVRADPSPAKAAAASDWKSDPDLSDKAMREKYGETYKTLNRHQRAVADLVIRVGQEKKLPSKAWVIALAAGMQESKLRNIDYGDRDSQGVFQMRPSQGWGTVKEVRDPVYAAHKFYNVLKGVSGWRKLPVTVAAQAVEKSGYPSAYAQWEGIANRLVADGGGQRVGDVFYVGDSLGEGTVPKLEAAGLKVTADVLKSRHASEGVAILRAQAAAGTLPSTVVVDLGTNDSDVAAFRKQVKAVLKIAGPERTVWWVTPHNSAAIAAELAKISAANSSLQLIDEAAAVRQHPDWLEPDGIHLTAAGYEARAKLIAGAVGIPDGETSAAPQLECASDELAEPSGPETIPAAGPFVDAIAPAGTGPYSAAKIVRYLRENPRSYEKGPGYCLFYAQESAGYSHFGPSAYAYWVDEPAKYKHADRNVPPGAVMLFRKKGGAAPLRSRGDGGDPGHAIAYMGNGWALGTDMRPDGGNDSGAISRIRASYIETKWNMEYLGWMEKH